MTHWTRLFPVPSIFSKVVLWSESNSSKVFTASSGGVFQRSEYTIFGAPRQLCRIPRAHCGSLLYSRFSSNFLIFWTRFFIEEATNWGILLIFRDLIDWKKRFQISTVATIALFYRRGCHNYSGSKKNLKLVYCYWSTGPCNRIELCSNFYLRIT